MKPKKPKKPKNIIDFQKSQAEKSAKEFIDLIDSGKIYQDLKPGNKKELTTIM